MHAQDIHTCSPSCKQANERTNKQASELAGWLLLDDSHTKKQPIAFLKSNLQNANIYCISHKMAIGTTAKNMKHRRCCSLSLTSTPRVEAKFVIHSSRLLWIERTIT